MGKILFFNTIFALVCLVLNWPQDNFFTVLMIYDFNTFGWKLLLKGYDEVYLASKIRLLNEI